jgi:riboflavin synthase
MFTGLVLGQGRVRAIEARGDQVRLVVAPLFALDDIVIGESIAVNGACLTVESASGGAFSVYASAETTSRTSLGALRPGGVVNLERALKLSDRLGGHLVSGHVDCLATVAEVRPAGESRVYRLEFPADQGPFVIEKGSVCLDGVSLTINACGPNWLEVNVIPETRRVTTIEGWKPGYRVNMETDLIGKYVSRMLAPWQGNPGAKPGGLSLEFLREHGF